jgi:hypothetical protein
MKSTTSSYRPLAGKANGLAAHPKYLVYRDQSMLQLRIVWEINLVFVSLMITAHTVSLQKVKN